MLCLSAWMLVTWRGSSSSSSFTDRLPPASDFNTLAECGGLMYYLRQPCFTASFDAHVCKSALPDPESWDMSTHLCCKAFNVALLSIELLLCHKHGKVCVLHACLTDSIIKPPLNGLPNMIGSWTQDVAACATIKPGSADSKTSMKPGCGRCIFSKTGSEGILKSGPSPQHLRVCIQVAT